MKKQVVILANEGLRDRVIEVLRALDLSKRWEVTIARKQRTRTLSQNNLYWKWISDAAEMVADYTGHDIAKIHDYFKRKFLPAEIIEIAGDTHEYRTTTTLTTSEMCDYMERVDAWCATELGIVLPRPSDLFRNDRRDL